MKYFQLQLKCKTTRIKNSFVILFLIIIFVGVSSQFAQAVFNKQINYQGKLTNSSGVAVANGDYNMEFKLMTVASGGDTTQGSCTTSCVWIETRTGANKVTVTNGLFSVLLGEVTTLSGVDFNQTLYLMINIGGTGSPSWDGVMTPRKKLGAVPAAVESERVGGFTPSQSATNNEIPVLNSGELILSHATAAGLKVTGSNPLTFQNGTTGDIKFFSSANKITSAGALTLAGAIISGSTGSAGGLTLNRSSDGSSMGSISAGSAYLNIIHTSGTTIGSSGNGVFFTTNGTWMGKSSISNVTPTALVHIPAGTATASTAPLKFTAGTNLTAAEAGAMEWDGTNLFITQTTGPTRKTIAYTSDLTGGYIPYTGGTSNVDLGIHNLTVDTNSLFVDATNHRVGVGTITPTSKFEVSSAGGAGTGINLKLTSGSSYVPIDFNTLSGLSGQFLSTGNTFSSGAFGGDEIVLASELTSGVLHLASIGSSGIIKFTTGGNATGNERMRINSSGNVGIGTTTPFSGATTPIASLELGTFNGTNADGNLTVRGYAALGGISKSGYGAVGSNYYLSSANALLAKNTDSVSLIEFSAGGFIFKNAGSTTANTAISLTELWRMTSSGNFITGTDNTYDIGASGATRPRTGYFGTSIIAPSAYFTPPVTTGTGATAGVQILANSLTTGNGLDVSSSSITSGNLVSFSSSTSSTAASNTQTILNVATSGANPINQTTYGGYFSNTHTGTNSVNTALYATASGGSTNLAANFGATLLMSATAPCISLQLGTCSSSDNYVGRSGTGVTVQGSGATTIAVGGTEYIAATGGALRLGFSASANVLINTSTNSGHKLDVIMSGSGLTTSRRTISGTNTTTTYDTTAGALSSYGGYFSNTSTRSAGSNDLNNIGLYTTASGAQNNYAIEMATTALTQTTAVTTNINGLNLSTAGALVQNTAAGTINWTGANIVMPNITQTTGTVTSTGIKITGGTVTSGTSYAFISDTNAGNVGIGITTPTYPLDVSSNANNNKLINITNVNTGVSAQAAYVAQNGTFTSSYGIAGTSHATYGALVANSAFAYTSSSVGFVIMSDNASGVIKFSTGGSSERWRMNASGHFIAGTDNTYDIGASGATRPRSLYVGTSITNGGNYTQSTGAMSLTSANTTETTTASAFAGNFNSLTSGTGMYLASSTISSGKVIDVQVNSTATSSTGQTGINVLLTGANGTASQTTYGLRVSNTHTGTTPINWSAYFDERVNVGAANQDANHALIVRSVDNTANHGLKITAANQTASMELGYNTISTAGGMVLSIGTTTGLQIQGAGAFMYVGGAVTPTARIHIAAGTTAASSAPLKFTSGTNMTTAEAGAVEWDGTNLFITQTTGPTRKTLAYTSDLGGYLQNNIGISGGTTLIGGTGSGENLTLTSTSNATKGKIFFGTLSVYDQVNDRIGIGQTTPTSRIDITTNSLGTTQTTSSGLALVNTTAASAGAQQISPAIRWTGQGWKTNATAASQAVEWQSYVLPLQGTSEPESRLVFRSSFNSGAFTERFGIKSTGALYVNNNYGNSGDALLSNGSGGPPSWTALNAIATTGLTNGSGTTATGTAVDLGGTLASSPVIELSGNTFDFTTGGKSLFRADPSWLVEMGDFGGNGNNTYLSVNDSTQTITAIAGNRDGIFADATNHTVRIGDAIGNGNGYYIFIDDTNNTIGLKSISSAFGVTTGTNIGPDTSNSYTLGDSGHYFSETWSTTFRGFGLYLGSTGVGGGAITMYGGVSGSVIIQPQTNAGSYNFNLPITAGTSGYVLTSGGGGATAMTWTDPAALGVRWNALTVPNGNLSLAHGANTTAFTFNSVSTGTAFAMSSTSLSSGTILDLSSNGTAALTNQKGLNISLQGAVTGAQTTYGAYLSNTHTGASAVNVGLYATASGATGANYAAIFNGGNVGIGTTTPSNLLNVAKTFTSSPGSGGLIDSAMTLSGSGIDFVSASAVKANLTMTGNNTFVSSAYGASLIGQFSIVSGADYTYTAGHQLAAILARPYVDGSGSTADWITGIRVQPQFYNSAAVTSYTGILLQAPDLSGGGTLTNKAGIYSESGAGNSTFMDELQIGSATDLGAYKLQVTGDSDLVGNIIGTGSLTSVAGSGQGNLFTTNHTVNTSASYIGTNFVSNVTTSTSNSSTVVAQTATINNNSSTNMVTGITGYQIRLNHSTTGTITSNVGIDVGGFVANGGAMSTVYGMQFNGMFTPSTGTVGTQYGYYYDQTYITPTTGYAFYSVVNPSGGTLASLTDISIAAGSGKGVKIGTGTPTAWFHIKAGTATAGQAPLKFTSGTNLTTTEAGAVEYDGTHLYFTATNGGTRYQLDQQGGSSTWNSITNPTGTQSLTFDDAELNSWTVNSDTETFHTISSSTLTSGTLLSLVTTGTGALSGQKGLNVSLSGANGTSTQTTYGIYSSNAKTGTSITDYAGYFTSTGSGTTSTNVGIYAEATGATTNYAAQLNGNLNFTSAAARTIDVASGSTAANLALNIVAGANTGGGSQAGGSLSLTGGAASSGTGGGGSVTIVGGTSAGGNGGSVVINAASGGNADGAINIGTTRGAISMGNGSYNFSLNSFALDISTAGAISGATGYIQTSGTMSLTSANTTEVTTASAFALNVNSLTSGTGFYAASSTLSSGSLVNLAVTGTAAASNTQKVLNISTSGANATSTQTTYGGYFSNTHTGTSSTNIGLYSTASGGTTNYAAIFDLGQVGIGTTAPTGTLTIGAAQPTTNASGNGTAAIALFNTASTTGKGGDSSYSTGTVFGGNGAAFTLVGGTGGAITGTPTTGYGGNGGAFSLTAGTGGAGGGTTANGGVGGNFTIAAGAGGFGANSGGLGGYVEIKGGNAGSLGNIDGGNVYIVGGSKNSSGIDGNVILGSTNSGTLRGNIGIGDTTPASLLTVGSGDLFQVNSSGNVTLNSVNTTQTTTSSIVAMNANSLTTGTGFYATSSTLTTGKLIDLQVSSTAAATNQVILDILTTGSISTAATTYGIKISNTHSSGAADPINIGLYANASGGTTNYAGIFDAGSVGIGDTTPDYKLDVADTGIDGNIFSLTDSDGECLYNPEAGGVTVSCSSDERLKKDIVDAPSALSYFKSFRVREYNVKASGDKMIGVIAQEVLITHPELVTVGPSGMYSVQLPSQWQIVEAIQELDLKVEGFLSLDTTKNNSVGYLMKTFLSDIGNTVDHMYASVIHANKIETKELCVGSTCVTEEQFLRMVQASSNSNSGGGGSGGGNPPPTPPADVCPNIDGDQVAVPDGMHLDESNNCVSNEGAPDPTPDPAPTPDPEPTPEPPPTE